MVGIFVICKPASFTENVAERIETWTDLMRVNQEIIVICTKVFTNSEIFLQGSHFSFHDVYCTVLKRRLFCGTEVCEKRRCYGDYVLYNTNNDVSVTSEGARFVSKNCSCIAAWKQGKNLGGARHAENEDVDDVVVLIQSIRGWSLSMNM